MKLLLPWLSIIKANFLDYWVTTLAVSWNKRNISHRSVMLLLSVQVVIGLQCTVMYSVVYSGDIGSAVVAVHGYSEREELWVNTRTQHQQWQWLTIFWSAVTKYFLNTSVNTVNHTGPAVAPVIMISAPLGSCLSSSGIYVVYVWNSWENNLCNECSKSFSININI